MHLVLFDFRLLHKSRSYSVLSLTTGDYGGCGFLDVISVLLVSFCLIKEKLDSGEAQRQLPEDIRAAFSFVELFYHQSS